MKTGNLSARYVPAKISFEAAGKTFEAGEHLMNAAGVMSFDWTQFDPMQTVARTVKVKAQLKNAASTAFDCAGYLTCEQTEKSKQLGLGLLLTDAQSKALNAVVDKEGVLPSFARKFPRIPFMPAVGIMPERAILYQLRGQQSHSICCDLDNISPTGLQIKSEDFRFGTLVPGATTVIELMPRGNNPNLISFEGIIRRIVRAYNTQSKNLTYSLGLNISSMDEENKTIFASLLREIVNQLKDT